MWFPWVVVYGGSLRVIWGKLGRQYVWYRLHLNDESYFKLALPEDVCSLWEKFKLWRIGSSEFLRWVEGVGD